MNEERRGIWRQKTPPPVSSWSMPMYAFGCWSYHRLLSPWIPWLKRCSTPLLQVAEYKAEWAKLDKEIANCIPRSLNSGLLWLIPPVWKQWKTCFNQYPGQETQNVYDEKRKEKTKQWEAEVKTYMELPKWKARHRPPFGPCSGRWLITMLYHAHLWDWKIQPAEFMNMWAQCGPVSFFWSKFAIYE